MDVEDLAAKPVVGWYRPDDTRKLLRILLPTILPMVLGSVTVGYAYARLEAADPASLQPRREPPAARAPHGGVGEPLPGVLRGPRSRPQRIAEAPAGRRAQARGRGAGVGTWLLFVVGFALVVAGPSWAIFGLRRTWKDERWLLLRVDGLIQQRDGEKLCVRWEDVERVRYDDEGQVVRLELRDGGAVVLAERYADVGPEELASRLEEIRRKASFGLLPQQRARG